MRTPLSVAALAGCLWLTPACETAKTPAPPARAEVLLQYERRDRERFGLAIRDLLLQAQYDSLEAMAGQLRRDRTRWPGGSWKLRAFYYEGFDGSVPEGDSAAWVTMIDALRRWRDARPQSLTAHVALVNGLVGHAWQARGNGVAAAVGAAGFAAMAQRLAEARAVLVEGGQLPDSCPGWWAAAQRVALGEGWDRATYDRLVDEAARREPTFGAYYELKARHLLPRWYGKPGEWEAYAEAVANGPGAEGDATYARIVWYLHEDFGNIFRESTASWERVRRGFDDLVQRYPESLELKSAFAYLAHQADDRETARRLFAEIGPRIDPSVWKTAGQFEYSQFWAEQAGGS